MAKLNGMQVAQIVTMLGAPRGTTVAEWVAKAEQESGGDTAIADTETGTHWGLWQISEIHAGKGGTSRDLPTFRKQIVDPFRNFAVAKVLYEADGWRPWAASGGKPTPTEAHKLAAEHPAFDVVFAAYEWSDPVSDVVGAVTDPVEALAGAVKDGVEVVIAAGAWLAKPGNWGRIAFVVLGGTLAVTAAAIVLVPQAKELSPL